MKIKSLIFLITPIYLLSSCGFICIGSCDESTPKEEEEEQQTDPKDLLPPEERKYIVDKDVFKKYYNMSLFMESKFEAHYVANVESYHVNHPDEKEFKVVDETYRFDLEKMEIIRGEKDFIYVRYEEERAYCYSNYGSGWSYFGDYKFYWKNDFKKLPETIYLQLEYSRLVYDSGIHAYRYNNNGQVKADDIVIQYIDNVWQYLEFSYDYTDNYTKYIYTVRIDISNWGETTIEVPVIE